MKFDDVMDLFIFPMFTLIGGIYMYLNSLTKEKPFSWVLFIASCLYALLMGCFIVFVGKAFSFSAYLIGALCCLSGLYGNVVIEYIAKKYLNIDVKKPAE